MIILMAGFLNVNTSPNTKPRVANYGLMDQIAALHWIKGNIAAFGGDPENITMMGYESGAACIHFLMSSPAVVPGEQLSIDLPLVRRDSNPESVIIAILFESDAYSLSSVYMHFAHRFISSSSINRWISKSSMGPGG